MRMRIRASHNGAFVLEYLHPHVFRHQLFELFDPPVRYRKLKSYNMRMMNRLIVDILINNGPNFDGTHGRQSFVRFWMETHNATSATSLAGLEKWIVAGRWRWYVL